VGREGKVLKGEVIEEEGLREGTERDSYFRKTEVC